MLTRKKIFAVALFLLLVIGGFAGSRLVSASGGKEMFTGKENHKISMREAQKLMANFRKQVPEASVIGGFFGKNALMNILAQPGVVGIRAYFANEENGTPTLILFGVNANGDDVIVDGVGPLERWFPCPPFCPKNDTVTVAER